MNLTFIPTQFSNFLQGLFSFFRKDHQNKLAWFVLCQMLCQEKTTLTALARLSANHVKEHHFRRLLCAKYWNYRELIQWFAERTLQSLPGAKDKILFLIVDGTWKGKRGKKHPLVTKGRTNSYCRYIFGIQIVFLVVHWGNYRVVIDFEVVRPKDHPKYKKPNILFRRMLLRFQPPDWAKKVIVLADSAFASKKNFKMIRQKGFFYVFAIARTWKFGGGGSLKNLAKHTAHSLFQKVWLPLDQKGTHRQIYWTFRKRAELRELGDVTILLSKTRRKHGHKKTKILVTNLPNPKSRDIVKFYKKRWWIEVAFKELKGAVGLGQHQVTGDPDRVEKSLAMAVVAYMTLIKFRAQDIPEYGPWSLFQLKQNFILEVFKEQIEHSVILRLRKELKLYNAA